MSPNTILPLDSKIRIDLVTLYSSFPFFKCRDNKLKLCTKALILVLWFLFLVET